MKLHPPESGSSRALPEGTASSSRAIAGRVQLLLFSFSQGNRTFCEIDLLQSPPACFCSSGAPLLWRALSDAERLAMARDACGLTASAECKNSRRDDGTERRGGLRT